MARTMVGVMMRQVKICRQDENFDESDFESDHQSDDDDTLSSTR